MERYAHQIYIAVQSIDFFDEKKFNAAQVGIEIQDFADPSRGVDSYASLVSRYSEKLASVHVPVALHAPILPLNPRDAASLRHAGERYRLIIGFALQLRVRCVVFHSGIDPDAYAAEKDAHLDSLAAFWKDVAGACANSGIIAALENVREDDYGPLRLLIERINIPQAGICLDIGHQRLNSRQHIEEWLLRLTPYVRHIHIHDNSGMNDSHRALDDAALVRFISLCDSHDMRAGICLEYRNTDAGDIEQTLGRVRRVLSYKERMHPKLMQRDLLSYLLQIAVPAAAALVLFFALIFNSIIPRYEEVIMDRKREMMRELVRSAASVAQHFADAAAHGYMTADRARSETAAIIGAMRHGTEYKDYFWITDMHPRMIMHPYRPDLIGRDLSLVKDPGGKLLFVESVSVLRTNTTGFIDYQWQRHEDAADVIPKLSCVVKFQPWGWIIGTGLYLKDIRDEIARIERRLIVTALAICALIAGILALVARNAFRMHQKRVFNEKSLTAAREKYRMLVEAATDGVVLWTDGRIVFANQTASTILGYRGEELLLRTLGDILDTEDAAVAHWLAGGMHTTAQFETALRTASGIPFDALVHVTPVSFETHAGVIVLFRSIAITNPSLTPRARVPEYSDHIAMTELLRKIDSAHTTAHVREVHEQIPSMVMTYTAEGMAAYRIAERIALTTRAIIRRYVTLTEHEIGPAPCPYCFITLGSVARGEQTLVSDQDNALAFSDSSHAAYFLELGRRVAFLLDTTGFSYCAGRIMAKNGRYCVSVDQWKDYLHTWVRAEQPEQVLDLTVFYDMQPACGDGSIVQELSSVLRDALAVHQPCVNHIARRVTPNGIPCDARGHITLTAAENGRLDIKRVMGIVVDGARAYAMKSAAQKNSTRERIMSCAGNGMIAERDAGALIESYDYLMRIRFTHQTQCIARNIPADNSADISAFNEFDRAALLTALNQVAVFQRSLQRTFEGL